MEAFEEFLWTPARMRYIVFLVLSAVHPDIFAAAVP